MPRTGVSDRASAMVSLLVPLLCAPALFLLLYIVFLSHLWGDQAFLMYAAKQMLAGMKLDGSQLVETNPPMVVWFSVLPMLLSQAIHLLPDYSLWFVLMLILIGSTVWSYRLLRMASLGISPGILAALIGVVEFAIRPALFGQKEQIAVALLMPYIVSAMTDVKPSLAERIAIGLLAGVGVCFKPHQVLVVVLFECFLLVRSRSVRRLVRPEVIAAVCAGLVYVFCVAHFTPYLTAVTPVLTDTYWALGTRTFAQLLRHEAGPLTAGLLAVVCALVLLRDRIDITLPGGFAACSAGSAIAFYVQHTGWYYQAFPAKAFLTLAFVTLVLEWVAARAGQRLVFVRPPVVAWVVAVGLAFVAFGGAAFLAHRSNARVHAATLDSELESLPEGTTVYAFSIEMSQFRVILDHKLRWGSRFAHLWMMPAIIQNEYPRDDANRPFKVLGNTRTEELASMERGDTAEDFRRWQPQYVFVEKCEGAFHCDIYNHAMNFVAWYSQDAAFALEWSHYRFDKTVDNFDLYVRR